MSNSAIVRIVPWAIRILAVKWRSFATDVFSSSATALASSAGLLIFMESLSAMERFATSAARLRTVCKRDFARDRGRVIASVSASSANFVKRSLAGAFEDVSAMMAVLTSSIHQF
ncbi:MAG: hypothetical protein K2Y02_00865 [Burkholderiaceae bacterium]|nr:hypothetical protein [Burkholderiaceae bacterium]